MQAHEYSFTSLPPHCNKWVTAQLPRKQPVYNWFVYPHSFSKELVHYLLDLFALEEGNWVLDPFVGAGTTLLAAKERGINAEGYDILPLSVMVSSTKIEDYQISALDKAWKKLDTETSIEIDESDIPLINKAYSPEVRARLMGILGDIKAKASPKKIERFFHLALLSISEKVSKTQKSGGWLRIVPDEEQKIEITPDIVSQVFSERVESMLGDVRNATILSRTGVWRAHLGDAREKKGKQKYHAIITSPPYLNRHDYTRVFALELATGFLTTNDSLKQYRYRSLRSHTEARTPSKIANLMSYTAPSRLSEAIEQLPDPRISKNCDIRIHQMITGYFEDMYSVLSGLSSQLIVGGHLAFVIGNVRFAGIPIMVDEIVAEIGEQAGLKCETIMVARERGNSAQQMRDHGKINSRESIVVWRKL